MKIIGFKLVSLAILGGLIGGCSTYTEQVVSQSFQPAEAPVNISQIHHYERGDFSTRAKRPVCH